jgi:hypothetical protein
MRIQSTLIVVCATNAASGPTDVARAGKRAWIVGTSRVGVTVVRIQSTFIVVRASDTAASPPNIARTRE